MTATAERPSLREFLLTTASRTGDRYEAAALAEMAGYSVEDARAEGWPDIFFAAQSLPMVIEDESPPEPPPTISAMGAFVRGLTYTAPVVAIWALFPRPMTASEIRYLALAVLLSWGGSMASNNVVGTWRWGDERAAWRLALAFAVFTTSIAVVAGGALVHTGWIGTQTAVVGALQVVYFFSASPLMLLRRRGLLTAVAVLGAVAGLGVLVASVPGGPLAAWSDAERVLQMAAAACLTAPFLLLVAKVASTRRLGRGHSVPASRRDTLAFGAYGASFGLLVLWGPVVLAGSSVAVLTLVIVAGIAFAELAVTLVRQRLDALLDETFDPETLGRRAQLIVLSGSLVYVVPVAVGVALGVLLLRPAEPSLMVLGAVLAVMALGTIQMFCLITMSVHGIRSVALAITTCAVALVVTSTAAQGLPGLLVNYDLVLVVLCGWLVSLTLRLCVHPINLI